MLPLFLLLLLMDDSVPRFTVPIVIGLIIGLTARLAHEWDKDTLTWKKALTRILYAFCLTYCLMFIWQDFSITHNILYSVIISSALSMEIVNESLKIGELGFKAWIRNKVNSFLGKNDGI